MSRKQYRYTCPVCQQGSGTLQAAQRHEQACRNRIKAAPNHTCSSCGTTFRADGELKAHVTMVHTPRRPLLMMPPIPKDAAHHCPDCNTFFSDPDAAAQCREGHKPEPTSEEMDEARSRMLELERALRKKQ